MSVRKKGNRWYCRFQIDGVRYERRCDLATDERSALQVEKIIATEIMRGHLDYAKAKSGITINQAVNMFLDYSKINKLSHKSDISFVKKILDFFGKNTQLDKITSLEIENFKTYLKAYNTFEIIKIKNPNYVKGISDKFIVKKIEKVKTRSNSTINRYIEVLSKIFNLCVENEKIIKNPCASVKHLREENYKIRYLTKDEEKRLFSVLDSEYTHLKPIIITALQTGMRKAEIFNLKWSQIDFKKGFIEVLKSKSGKARKIPISKKLDAVLKTQLVYQINEYVFINPATNKPYVDIKRAFSNILKKAEIENFRFHDFRHTVATRLVESGNDLVVVKDILGHSDIATTMRYSHPVPENKKIAIECL